MPVSSIRRVGRLITTLSVIPALMLSSFTAQAILIHDHHGHDTHSHALSIHELDRLQGNPEHQHEEHEHDDPAIGLADRESPSLVILLDLPEGIARGRALTNTVTVAAGKPTSPSTNMIAVVTQQSDHSYIKRTPSLAPPVCAHGLVTGILLTSHALLL